MPAIPDTSAIRPGDAAETVGVVIIHGVGETEPGWIDEFLIPHLQKAEPQFVPDLHTRVVKLAEPVDEAQRTAKFPLHLRDGMLGAGTRIHILELFWADLSRSSPGNLATTLASLRLFFEAPHVTARALLSEKLSGFDSVVRSIILLAIGLLRGPVTGLNISFLVVAFALIYYPKVPQLTTVSIFLVGMGVLGTLAAGATLLHVWLRDRDPTWADLSMATAWVSAALLVVFITNPLHGLLDKLQTPLQYFWTFRPVLLGTWIAWAAVLVAAIVLLVLRVMFDHRHSTRRVRHRLSAALGAAIAQSAFWLTVLPLLGVLAIDAARGDRRDDSYMVTVSSAFSNEPGTLQPLSKAIDHASQELWLTFVFDILCFAFVLLFIAVTVLARRLTLLWYGNDLQRAHDRIPRLILNSAVVWSIVLCGLALAPIAIARAYENVASQRLIELAPYAALVAYGGRQLWSLLHTKATVVLHIARDLVDHQFSPADHLGGRIGRAMGAKKTRALRPKRDRIQRRLDLALAHMAAVVKPSRVLFVAHSQGTVILLEYLRDRAGIRRNFPEARIDILTLGSPIQHLYGHYFHEYDDLDAVVGSIAKSAATWHNMCRVDDPIAHRITSGIAGFPTNEVLPKGGHTNYWSVPRVCATIMAMIRDPDRAKAAREKQHSRPAT